MYLMGKLFKITDSLWYLLFLNAGTVYFLYGFNDLLMRGLVCLILLLLLIYSHFLICDILLVL